MGGRPGKVEIVGPIVLAGANAALLLGLLIGGADGALQVPSSFSPVARGFNSPVYVTSAPGDPTTLYVDYTNTKGDTRVVEYRSSNGVGRPSSARRLLFVDQPYDNHNGGQLQFDRQGYLYVGMGDGGSGGDPQNRAQNLKSRLGKLLRVDPLRAGAGWQVVGFGLRNPWRFSFDRKTGNLWIGDVGQGAWEEVDYRSAARVGRLANYGWSRFEGRSIYDPAKPLLRRGELVSPVTVYSHGGGACSITGGYVYRGSAVPAAQGRYYYGDYCSGTIWSFAAGNGRLSAPHVEGKIEGLSSFGEDGNGELYATSLGGTIFRLTP